MHTDVVFSIRFSPCVLSLWLSFFYKCTILWCNHLVPNLSLPRGCLSTQRVRAEKKERGGCSAGCCFYSDMSWMCWMSRMYHFAREKSIREFTIWTWTWLQLCFCTLPPWVQFLGWASSLSYIHSLSYRVKDITTWPSKLNSSFWISCWEADFLTDSEIIWTVQLHFSTQLDNTHVRLRLEKPLIETSKVVTLKTVGLSGIRRVDSGQDHCHPCLKIKPTQRNVVHFLSKRR